MVYVVHVVLVVQRTAVSMFDCLNVSMFGCIPACPYAKLSVGGGSSDGRTASHPWRYAV